MPEPLIQWSALEWMLALELLVLVILSVMGAIGFVLGRLKDAEDPIGIFIRTFWNELLWPPEVMASDSLKLANQGAGGGGGSSASREMSDEDAFYGRLPKGADGRVAATELVILVVANAASDAVLGRDGDGIRIQVTGEAGDSRSNKALIELIAAAVGVQPFQVTLTKGHYQPRKTVQLQGVSNDDLEIKLSGLGDAD